MGLGVKVGLGVNVGRVVLVGSIVGVFGMSVGDGVKVDVLDGGGIGVWVGDDVISTTDSV